MPILIIIFLSYFNQSQYFFNFLIQTIRSLILFLIHLFINLLKLLFLLILFKEWMKIKLTNYWALFFLLLLFLKRWLLKVLKIWICFYFFLRFGLWNMDLTLCCVVLYCRACFEMVISWCWWWSARVCGFNILFLWLLICLIEVSINLFVFCHFLFTWAQTDVLKLIIIITTVLFLHVIFTIFLTLWISDYENFF